MGHVALDRATYGLRKMLYNALWLEVRFKFKYYIHTTNHVSLQNERKTTQFRGMFVWRHDVLYI